MPLAFAKMESVAATYAGWAKRERTSSTTAKCRVMVNSATMEF